ncbi:hypothetical protein KGF56_003006 [Candida oxycetoniae]|uniref:Uncharacterized protein n=1 Tax=Candida oxycetoniae TaxID=497107 RepID=A0AAI9WXX8_9ASCO|nr:uncharacterized protein KGF56_003006 [Candida oxycetoniae]KAI3404245.2 hypothetical protein KGF56_003006 [Candida oxycetoniae]
MGRRIYKRNKKESLPSTSTLTSVSTPVTPQDFFDHGSSEEESGDRWLGSDIAKSLRFYQRAYTAYRKCISLSSVPIPDAYYNSCRLALQVYLLFNDCGGLRRMIESRCGLQNIEEVVHASDSIVMDLPQILNLHLESLQVVKDQEGDLLFNTLVVYTEIMESEAMQEEIHENMVTCFKNATTIFDKLVKKQVEELESFNSKLLSIDTAINTAPSSSQQQQQQEQQQQRQEEEELYESERVVQPVDLFETVILGYRLVQAIYENTDKSYLETTHSLTQCLSTMDEISRELINKYSTQTCNRNEMLDNITSHQISELKIIRASITGLTMMANVQQVMEMWSNFFLQEVEVEIAEKYMVCSDNIQSYLEREDISIEGLKNNDEQQLLWDALRFQNTQLKKAQELLQETLAIKKRAPSGVELGIGSLIVQISELMIARVDINLQMSLLDLPIAAQNRKVLEQNVKNLLKSAIALAGSQGGLRERQIEKFNRYQKRNEALFRLCLVNGETSLDKLDSVITREEWVLEVPVLQKLGYYSLFLKDILDEMTSNDK